jgi:uncharacterized SAM-binding protein YcdF (DUF218 family)
VEKLEKFDLVIHLGSQVMRDGEKYSLAPHTKLRAGAAGIAWQKGITERFIIVGGPNWKVRYDDKQIIKADFSFEAFALSDEYNSEAKIIKEYLIENYDIPRKAMVIETSSAFTTENVNFLKIMLKRTPTFDEIKKIGILTQLYHMEKAFKGFKESFKKTKFEVKPLFVEDLLATKEGGIEEVCNYYSVPKGGKQWPVNEIKKLLSTGKSIGELLEI